MSRYIDADAVIEKKWQVESEACFYALEDVVSVTDIEEAPSIDIVRCKECKFREANKSIYRGAWYCSNHGDTVDLDDYCSLGERKSDE